ncbi:hypothetical protein NYR90_16570 [Clostridioides difficile]|nr:hypothetical protein NYR90_16570 [Clostridioides difficile]UWI51120.1 hypothetical protein NZ312_05315 [Clostridioides difficile]
MNKFIKVSIFILGVFTLFIAINKLVYRDMVSVKDYEINHLEEIVFDFDSRRSEEIGTVIRFKISNNSKYSYRLNSAKMRFENCIESKKGENKCSYYVNIDLFNEKNSITEKTLNYGIKSNNQGYVDFVIPKGLNFDYRYFNDSGMSVEYKGEFTVEMPIAKGLYLVVGKNNDVWNSNVME